MLSWIDAQFVHENNDMNGCSPKAYFKMIICCKEDNEEAKIIRNIFFSWNISRFSSRRFLIQTFEIEVHQHFSKTQVILAQISSFIYLLIQF